MSPERARAGLGLLLLPLAGLPHLAPTLEPGPLSVGLIVLASLVVLALVLRSEGPRTLGVLGALTPLLAMIGAGLDHPVGPGQFHQFGWAPDSWVATFGQLALLALGLGPPVFAGLRLRRSNTPFDIRVLALLLTRPSAWPPRFCCPAPAWTATRGPCSRFPC